MGQDNITYEKIGDYYLFSHEPDTRVYLGDAKPEDYILDELDQQKRTNSAWYKEVHTGKEITFDEVLEYDHDGSKPGNGCVWYDGDNEDDGYGRKKDSYTFEGGFSYDYTRRISLSSMGGPDKECRFVDTQSARRLAWAWYFNQTLEEYDFKAKESDDQREKEARERPYLHNLIWFNGETYYVDDNGTRITTEEHEQYMKKKFGEDVFELVDLRRKAALTAMALMDEE